MSTGKTIALTRRSFVGKVMSLLLKMLSRQMHYSKVTSLNMGESLEEELVLNVDLLSTILELKLTIIFPLKYMLRHYACLNLY